MVFFLFGSRVFLLIVSLKKFLPSTKRLMDYVEDLITFSRPLQAMNHPGLPFAFSSSSFPSPSNLSKKTTKKEGIE